MQREEKPMHSKKIESLKFSIVAFFRSGLIASTYFGWVCTFGILGSVPYVAFVMNQDIFGIYGLIVMRRIVVIAFIVFVVFWIKIFIESLIEEFRKR
jgi:hypothetical protein